MCLNEITNDIPITKGYKVFCDETESNVFTPFYVKNIPKRTWIEAQKTYKSDLMNKIMRSYVAHPVKSIYTIFGKSITINSEESFYEAGYHVFHNKEDAEKYISYIITKEFTITIKIMNIFRPVLPKSKNLMIKEVLVEDPICVGIQRYGNFSALTTVARKMYVL